MDPVGLDNSSITANAEKPASQPGNRLRQAVDRAARANLVIVAAAGNDGQGQNLPAFPRLLAHVALASAVVLLGVAVLGAAVLRGTRLPKPETTSTG